VSLLLDSVTDSSAGTGANPNWHIFTGFFQFVRFEQRGGDRSRYCGGVPGATINAASIPNSPTMTVSAPVLAPEASALIPSRTLMHGSVWLRASEATMMAER
jgi:hypothetical protein